MEKTIIGKVDKALEDTKSIQKAHLGIEFTSGGNYGIEVSSVNNLKIMKKLFELGKKYDVSFDRFDECRGAFRLSDEEIKRMLELSKENGVGMIFSIGPRAIYDVGGFSKSKNGSRMGYRLRGIENIKYAIEEVYRIVSLGGKGVLVYDEGLRGILQELKKEGKLPQDLIIKVSVHMGCSNPISAKVYEDLGASTINLIPDLTKDMLSSFRNFVRVPLDLFTDTAIEAGGFLRNYEVPGFIELASPIYLKCGSISQEKQNHLPNEEELEERVKQVRNVLDMIKRHPDFKRVDKEEKTLAISKI